MPMLLIAVRSMPLADALRSRLCNNYDISICSTPEETAILIADLHPDAMIADIRMLCTIDLPHIHIPDPRPKSVLVLTDIATESVLESIYEAGANAAMLIPCRIDAVIKILERITKEVPHPEFSL